MLLFNTKFQFILHIQKVSGSTTGTKTGDHDAVISGFPELLQANPGDSTLEKLVNDDRPFPKLLFFIIVLFGRSSKQQVEWR
jgi:hypothetical protein